MATTEAAPHRFLVLLVWAAVILTAVLVKPFWTAFVLAAVLAAALRSWNERLARRLGNRRNLAAALLTVGVLLAVVLPVAGLGAVVVAQIVQGVTWLREALESEGILGLVRRLPGSLEPIARDVVDALPRMQLQQLAGEQGQQAAQAVGGVLAKTGGAVFQTVMMLISLFFFLVDGPKLVRWIDGNVPMKPGQFRELTTEFRQTAVSVLVATVATAGIQTLTALVGFFIARAPNPLFLGLVTFVVALIPALGGAIVVVSVALLLLATGHPVAGIFLAAWGIVVVSLIDNVARPYLLKGGMELHGGIVFFALLGGLAAFGGIGLVLGPVIVTFLIAILRIWRREAESARGPAAPPPPEAVAAAKEPPPPPAATRSA
jgi:predicted PurR-regulated permease PerM